MMKYITKKITILSIILITFLSSVSCSSISSDKTLQEKPNFKTQKVTWHNLSFKIPSTWSQMDLTTLDVTGIVAYGPNGSKINSNNSNINLLVDTSTKGLKLSDINSAEKKRYEKQIKTVFNNPSNFKFSTMSVNAGDTFIMEYDVTTSKLRLHTTQYMVLLKDYSVIITATNYGDNTKPNPGKVAKYVAQTLKIDE